MTYSEPQDVYTVEDLSKLVKSDNTIRTSITIRGEYLTEIVGVEKIDGTLGSVDSKLASFGTLREVTGDVWFSMHTVAPLITTMGNLESVGGDLRLNNLKIRSLGGMKKVGRTLNLRNVPIEDFGSLEFVGGNVLLHKNLQGKVDLGHIEIRGKVKYFNDQKNILEDILENPTGLAESEIQVPLWKKVYAYSVEVLNSADAEQKDFYRYFKQSFLADRIVDVRGNSTYVFALMFDLIKEFRKHRDEQLVRQQLAALEKAYPIIREYTEENLSDAIEGKPEKVTPGALLSNAINKAVTGALEKVRLEYPGISMAKAGDAGELDVDDFEESDEEDESSEVEKFEFPPAFPLYTVVLTETRDEDARCLETSVAIDGKNVAVLKARMNSIKADISANRLFIQTLHSNTDDSFSVFCFELSSGLRLWQTREIPPGGSLFVDCTGRTLEAGLTYGYAEKYLMRLDYEGNILERNFRDGYEMIVAAEQYFANKEFDQARSLFLQALETKISINTKIKAAKKLIRIGKTLGDAELSQQFIEQVTRFEAKRQAERTLERPTFEAPPDDEAAKDNYWRKRRKQQEEEGGE